MFSNPFPDLPFPWPAWVGDIFTCCGLWENICCLLECHVNQCWIWELKNAVCPPALLQMGIKIQFTAHTLLQGHYCGKTVVSLYEVQVATMCGRECECIWVWCYSLCTYNALGKKKFSFSWLIQLIAFASRCILDQSWWICLWQTKKPQTIN